MAMVHQRETAVSPLGGHRAAQKGQPNQPASSRFPASKSKDHDMVKTVMVLLCYDNRSDSCTVALEKKDYLADFIPNLELLLHDLQRACRNMHGRVSARVRRGNDGHDMRPVVTIEA